MRKIKKIIKIILLGIIPLIILCLFSFVKEEVHETYCSDRHYCSWHYCVDYECKNVRERNRLYERSLFEVIEKYPLITLIIVLYIVSYVGYIIGLKRNAYAYIGFEDLGKIGLFSLIAYYVDAALLVFVPMILYKQIGTSILVVMLLMVVIPFIIRPIIVDWED